MSHVRSRGGYYTGSGRKGVGIMGGTLRPAQRAYTQSVPGWPPLTSSPKLHSYPPLLGKSLQIKKTLESPSL